MRLVLLLMKKKMQNEIYTALRQITLEKMVSEIFDITAGELQTGLNSEGEEIMCVVANNRVLAVTERSDDAFEDVERLCAWIYYMYTMQGKIMNL